MRHIIFNQANSSGNFSVALLIKGSAFNGQELRINYVQPLVDRGVAEEEVIAFTLKYDENGKAMPTMNMNAGWIMSHAPPPTHAACVVL